MHAVLDAWCSGCELCVAPCPVDCIVMRPAMRPWTDEDVRLSLERHRARDARLMRGERVADRRATIAAPIDGERARRHATVAAAIERAKARRAKATA